MPYQTWFNSYKPNQLVLQNLLTAKVGNNHKLLNNCHLWILLQLMLARSSCRGLGEGVEDEKYQRCDTGTAGLSKYRFQKTSLFNSMEGVKKTRRAKIHALGSWSKR